MLMRPFRQGVSLLQEDVSVMDDAVLLPDLPAQLPAEQARSEGGMVVPAGLGHPSWL